MTEPKCEFYGKCGGCSLQHVEYNLQIKNKVEMLKKAINFEDVNVFYLNPFNYRNRMDFIFHKNGLGLREKGKWYSIVNIDECKIADERINELIKEIKEFFKEIDAFDVKKHTGTFRFAVIRATKQDSSISFVLNADSTKIKHAVDKIKDFAKDTTAKNVIVTYVKHNSDVSISNDYFVVKGKDMIEEVLLGKRFMFSVQGFFQNNTAMAEQMHKYVSSLLKNEKGQLVDLYAGVGTFGIINSEYFDKIILVEEFQGSVDAAKMNIKLNNVNNAEAICLDAKNLKKINVGKDFVLVCDPPRSGMHPKTIKTINELAPKKIVYISCNVKQLEKEIKQLPEYKISSAALFDLFPQTKHFESVVELDKNIVI
ncbi:23S rRNA (uracil(1939)-C(5))-methyltransferase RlmD [Candidatus Woesearchaeota archaeon]|nr:MAG: 23S rRNA (uracil(1939)-C(5))-methyltransferase RlmD [Candidatus Woesearchaeota archaeon]